MSKTKLDDNSLELLADKLEYRIKHALESTLHSSIQTIVDGVISGLTTKINSLETENNTHRKDIVSLEKRVQTLETQRDADDQFSKRNFLRISGVEESTGENPDSLVMNICNTLKTGLSFDDIDRCHRVGKPKENGSRDILVKFISYRTRQKLYIKRTDLKKTEHGLRGTYINEHLTQKRSKLLFEARKLAGNGKVLGAWSADGTILVKILSSGANPSDDNPCTELIRIKTSDDLAAFH